MGRGGQEWWWCHVCIDKPANNFIHKQSNRTKSGQDMADNQTRRRDPSQAKQNPRDFAQAYANTVRNSSKKAFNIFKNILFMGKWTI